MTYIRILMLLCVAGCTTTNNIVVVVAPPVPNIVALPCRLPPDSPPIKSPGLALVHTAAILPAVARERHMAGCAGVLFRITAAGLPVEARVAVESPHGFAFGDAALTALAGDKFKPDQSTTDWRYMIYSFTFSGLPAPGRGQNGR